MSIEDHRSSIYLKLIGQITDNLARVAAENDELKKQLAAALATKKPE